MSTRDALAVPSRRQRLLRAPGLLFYLGVALAVVEGIKASSLQSFGDSVVTQLIWWPLAAIWGARFLAALTVARLQFSLSEWVRWLGVPLILGLVFVWARSDGPYDLRLALSRQAMDQAAMEIVAGGSTDRGWIGLWPAEDVERIPGGMRFIVSGGGFIDTWGFAYSMSGSRSDITDPESEDSYAQLDGGWFLWTRRF
jgi:hypothetical protein